MSAQKKKKNKSGDLPQKAASAAPGQALGFLLQETLLTHRLLSAKQGEFVSLELLDDVAVHKPDGTAELIQSTSTGGNNPVADRDPKLWKTIFNWLQTLKELKKDPASTRFVLYVSSPVSGPIVDAFAAATTVQEAQQALALARDELWGAAPEFAKRSTLPASLAKFVDPILSSEASLVAAVIQNFELQCGSGSPQADFFKALEQQIILEEVDIKVVAPQMLGWVKHKIEVKLEQQKPAIISRDEFATEMKACIRTTAFRQILQSFAPAPSDEEKEKEKLRTYVRQLELIELDQARILQAITDFLRSSSDRTEWGLRGEIHTPSFDAFEAEIHQTWSNHSLVVDAKFSAAQPVPRGQSLFGTCMTHQLHLQGIPPPPHFIRGCFHKLADTQALGWHPDFKVLLKEEEK